jgi:CRISPR-associated protein Csb1
MSFDLKQLDPTTRLLMAVELRPLQGDRFQPSGFPNLGAATYQTQTGPKLLVESAQSMANRLEATCWDSTRNRPIEVLDGISHVTVTRQTKFLTDTMLEAHRLNSPYLLENKQDPSFLERLKKDLGELEEGPVNRQLLARVLLKYDVGSLLHGVFLAKKELAGGRLRIARALSAFIEATGVRVAAFGGVKNDHVNPSGVTKEGFGNVPFARDEFTAERITLHVNLDLAQIRGYGLGKQAENLLVLLALHRIRKLLDGDLRLRTACDLEPVEQGIIATRPHGFVLPGREELDGAVRSFIAECGGSMTHETVAFDGKLPKGKDSQDEEEDSSDDGDGNVGNGG